MCFLISIFLCFALVPKLIPRTVDFHWYWYRILKFWYRDNPTFCFGVIFVGRPLLGKVTVVLNFLHLYTICLTVDLWSPNSLEMGFVTFSSLMNINSFSEVLSNLLCSWHDSLPQTWSDFDRSVLWIKQVTYWHLIVIALTEITYAQMDSNFTFKLSANPRDSHTFATHRYAILDHFQISEIIIRKYFSLTCLIRFSLSTFKTYMKILFWVIFMQKYRTF